MGQEHVIIIMGSSRDEESTAIIQSTLKKLGIQFELRISSAHKTPQKLLEMIDEYNSSKDRIVFITVAGRSNALSGFIDANTRYPVISCPPQSEKFGGADIYSSLRMPSGVSPLVILEQENAALAAAKILALSNSEISEKVRIYQQDAKNRIESDDEKFRKRIE
ncbi:MAG: 5-(carboxyamino)imidazole ribonucleotide mutase [Thermoproteota archaeon]|nr:5-(carboxyamino)imidazole ribonucleotide mutase [Thermoproteota archaeon]